MEESLLTSTITLWVAGGFAGLLLLGFLLAFLMSRSEMFTRPHAAGCSGRGCDVYRVQRSAFLRLFDFMFKTRAYSCQSCRKRFVRFKPREEDSHAHSGRRQTAESSV